jgi:hypothetical protein
VADFLKSESGIIAEIDPKGKIGELTVWVKDKMVVRKGVFKFPSKQSVLDAIQMEMNQ